MGGKLGITLDYILGTLDAIAQVAEIVPGAQAPLAAIADKYIKIAQAAARAHQAATGEPLDLGLLTPVELAK
jgi:hypothetical protein